MLVGFRDHDLLDNASPSYAGDAGLGKTAGRAGADAEADVILAVGVPFGEILDRRLRPARCAEDGGDADPRPSSGARAEQALQTADLPVQAHPDRLMPALAGLRLPAPPWAARTDAAHADLAAGLATPPQPGDLDMGEVMRPSAGATCPDDAIVTNGAGNFSIWTNKHFALPRRQRRSARSPAAMGYGLPAAIAAGSPAPTGSWWLSAGDGDFQMTCQELGCALQAGAWPIVLDRQQRHYGTIRMHQEQTCSRSLPPI